MWGLSPPRKPSEPWRLAPGRLSATVRYCGEPVSMWRQLTCRFIKAPRTQRRARVAWTPDVPPPHGDSSPGSPRPPPRPGQPESSLLKDQVVPSDFELYTNGTPPVWLLLSRGTFQSRSRRCGPSPCGFPLWICCHLRPHPRQALGAQSNSTLDISVGAWRCGLAGPGLGAWRLSSSRAGTHPHPQHPVAVPPCSTSSP